MTWPNLWVGGRGEGGGGVGRRGGRQMFKSTIVVLAIVAIVLLYNIL